ncbi:Hypothetical protein D9617_1g082830 [Elsinoe fawcettii]|nr:Hypothetical protein D9617_1g082830 [Elsinoe fawcettii]
MAAGGQSIADQQLQPEFKGKIKKFIEDKEQHAKGPTNVLNKTANTGLTEEARRHALTAKMRMSPRLRNDKVLSPEAKRHASDPRYNQILQGQFGSTVNLSSPPLTEESDDDVDSNESAIAESMEQQQQQELRQRSTVHQANGLSKAQMMERMSGKVTTPASYPDTDMTASRTSSRNRHGDGTHTPSNVQAAMSRSLTRNGTAAQLNGFPTSRVPTLEDWSTKTDGHQSNPHDLASLNGDRGLPSLDVHRGKNSANGYRPNADFNPAQVETPSSPLGFSYQAHDRTVGAASKRQVPGQNIHNRQLGLRNDADTMPTQQYQYTGEPNEPIPQMPRGLEQSHRALPQHASTRQVPFQPAPGNTLAAMKAAEQVSKTGPLAEISDPEAGSSPESLADLDYPFEQLVKMDFAALQSESFDRETKPSGSPMPFVGNNAELAQRLKELLDARDSAANENLLKCLTLDQWVEAGTWYTTKQMQIHDRMVQLRREKRTIAKKYEAQIKARYDVVMARNRLIDETRANLKQAGGVLLTVGTPTKKRKAPEPAHVQLPHIQKQSGGPKAGEGEKDDDLVKDTAEPSADAQKGSVAATEEDSQPPET